MVQAILIKFGDNDFHNTFMHAMSQLHTKEFIYDLPKEKIAFVFSEVLFSSYIIAQNRLAYNGLEKLDAEYIQHMKDYFKIESRHIFIGVDADTELANSDWRNGEWFYMNPYTFSSI